MSLLLSPQSRSSLAENVPIDDVSSQGSWTDLKYHDSTARPKSPNCASSAPEAPQWGTRSITPSESPVENCANPQSDVETDEVMFDGESHFCVRDHSEMGENHSDPGALGSHSCLHDGSIDEHEETRSSAEFDHTLDIDEEDEQDVDSESYEVSPLSGIPSQSVHREEPRSRSPDPAANSDHASDDSLTPPPKSEDGTTVVDVANPVGHSYRSWSPSELSDDLGKFVNAGAISPCLGFEEVTPQIGIETSGPTVGLGTSR